jgi:hypothetical protein
MNSGKTVQLYKLTWITVVMVVLFIGLALGKYLFVAGNYHSIQTGNTSGNIMNAGLVVKHEGWIYYTVGKRLGQGNYKGWLYKIRTDGSEKVKLSDNKSSYINIVDGTIFYINEGDQLRLYKVEKDGSGESRFD